VWEVIKIVIGLIRDIAGIVGILKKSPKLRFEIDKDIAQIAVWPHFHLDGAARQIFHLKVNLGIRYENVDEHQLTVKSLRVSLKKKHAFGWKTDIPLQEADSAIIKKGKTESLPSGEIIVPPRTISPVYMYAMILVIPFGVEGSLGKRHFIRVTLEAMNQKPQSVDLQVSDWSVALRSAFANLTSKS